MTEFVNHLVSADSGLFSTALMIVTPVLLALLLDFIFAEPRRYHPLVGFGNWAIAIERRLNKSERTLSKNFSIGLGVVAVIVAIMPWVVIASWLEQQLDDLWWAQCVISGIILYSAIGWQSLRQHGLAIARPLRVGDLEQAQRALAMIVSRDTDHLDEQQIAKAATESMLENGADAIFSAIFWFCLLGIPGVILYRLSNTLDAMWGYKNARFLYFGRFAARLDDALNYIPARLTALAYSMVGGRRLALKCWQQQAGVWKSPNAGPVMAAGAGAINVSLGGMAVYRGKPEQRPLLGPDENPQTSATERHIRLSLALIDRSLIVWVVTIALLVFSLSLVAI